jgi:hypothetical protein
VKSFVGDVKQISLADLPETVAVEGVEHNVRQELVAIAKYLKDNIGLEHVFVGGAQTLREVQGKVQELESLSPSAKFGILRELHNMVDILGCLEENEDLYNKFAEIMAKEFDPNLQRAVLLQEANRYLERAVI